MKKQMIRTALLAVAGVMMVACSKPTEYKLQVEVQYPELDGKMAYLREATSEKKVLDSLRVQNKTVTFTGSQEEPKACEIFIPEYPGDAFPAELPVILENGEILVTLGQISRIGNTKHNDELMEFLLALETFKQYIADKQVPSVEQFHKELADFLVQQIKEHRSTIVGKYIFDTYKERLNDEQKKDCQKALA